MALWLLIELCRMNVHVRVKHCHHFVPSDKKTLCSHFLSLPMTKLCHCFFISDRFVESGNWQIVNISSRITETDHGDCCRFNFSEAEFKISMKRKSLYYTFYITIPCVILTVIALTSFLIHVESGERIGFVTTVLLAMTVFLLIIPSWLPVTSEALPILGVLLEGTMIIITLILFANIFVQWIYFREGTPPDWVQTISRLCGRRKHRGKQQTRVGSAAASSHFALKSTASVGGIEMTESSRNSPVEQDNQRMDEYYYTWQRVSTKMDRVFFILFIIISVIVYGVYIGISL